MSTLDDVFAALERRSSRTIEDLIGLARIPSVSASGFDPKQVERSAEHCAGLLEAAGLERVEQLRIGSSHPYAVGEWLHAGKDAPTVLIYAHHDVQPPGRPERWQTPAWEPTERGDGRLYGRGVVDDKAGLLLHLAALRAWLDATGALPVNVKLIVEGEEEIGSPNLEAFLRQQLERLRADVIVLSDTANLATGLPSLTTSLRGLLTLNLRVQALDHPVHSGMWGGPVMDAAAALVLLLGRLVDERGCPKLPGLDADVPALSAADRARLAALPFDEGHFRSDAGLLPSSKLAGDPRSSVYERIWFRPAIAVTAFESVPMARATNQLIDEARAQVGVRLAPGQDPERVRELVLAELRRDPPWGVQVEIEVEGAYPGWLTTPEGPAFEAAARAMRRGFGRDPVYIGCGGSIPFVGPFSAVLSGAPALLLGLEDPVCNAHGENESLHLEDFRKASRSAACLLSELAAAL
jgi:cysteinylglycine-S-conjugate dipeptidase